MFQKVGASQTPGGLAVSPSPCLPTSISMQEQARGLKRCFIYPFLVFMEPALVHRFQHFMQGKITPHQAWARQHLVALREFLFLNKCHVEPQGLG